MTLRLVLPAVAAVAVALPAVWPQRRLHPALGARVLASALAAVLLAVVAALVTLAVGFVSAIPWFAEHFSWCDTFSRTHGEVPLWLGVPAVGMLVLMAATGGAAYTRARRCLWARRQLAADVLVVDDDRPDAYARGGRHGHVVVSAGMLRLLDPAEREVLLAHERSHLRHRHHRFLALAMVAGAALPPLGFLTRRLRLAVERWADEDAAAEVGDRRLVAATIARAALARTEHRRRLGLAVGLVGVPARVDALLLPPPASTPAPLDAVLALPPLAVAVLGGATLQVHHLWRFAAHVCGL